MDRSDALGYTEMYMNLLTGKRELSNTTETAIKLYNKTISKRIYISEGIGDVGHNQIHDTIATFMQVNPNSRPLVIIDYLQLMSSPNPKSRLLDKQIVDKNMLELKRMSRDFNLPIIVISSNCENYTNADVVIALSRVIGADNEYPREVKLGILKNRFYEEGTTTFFKYYPEIAYFEENERANIIEAEKEKNECPF